MNLSEDYEFEVYEDEGKSGFYSDRPDFQRMIHDVERRKIKAIVCYKLDRISRKMSDLTNMIDFLNKYDCALLMPYVFHPFHVAEQMTDEATTIVALLHDVVEDTDYTLEDIAAEGFGKEILEAVALMTHEDGVPYLDYVAKLKDNPIARTVKLADLAHNSDLSRIGEIDEETKQRLEKYKKAKAILERNE